MNACDCASTDASVYTSGDASTDASTNAGACASTNASAYTSTEGITGACASTNTCASTNLRRTDSSGDQNGGLRGPRARPPAHQLSDICQAPGAPTPFTVMG